MKKFVCVLIVLLFASSAFGAMYAREINGQNGFDISNDSSGVLSWKAANEDFKWTVTSNTLTGSSSTGVNTLNFPAINGGFMTDMVFEGATADAHEAIIRVTDPTADTIWTIPVAAAGTYSLMSSTLATNAADIANSVWGGTNQIILEGATANAHEAIITPADPTADRTFTLPDASGTVVLSTLATNAPEAANAVTGASSALVFEGATANDYETSVTVTDPTADRTVTIPNKSGTVQLASAAVALTPGAAVTLTVGQGNLYTDTIVTDNEDQTITFSGAGTAGDVITILFITDTGAGSGDEVITFHSTLVSSTGTLTLADGDAAKYTATFISDGSHWYEISRTAVQ